jgi:O-antigen/teichoic acid export membrane protein
VSSWWSRHRAVRNFGATLIAEILGQGLAFLLGIYLARTLGPEGFGVWVFAVAIITYLAVLVDGGTELWGMREVSARPARLLDALVGVASLRLALCLGALVLIGAGAWLLDGAKAAALWFGATTLLALVINSQWAHRAVESAAPAVALLLQRLSMLALVLWLVHQPADAAKVTLWQGVSEIAAAVFLLAALVPRLRRAEPLTGAPQVSVLLRAAWPMGVARVMRALPAAASPTLLGAFWATTEVGQFGVAMRIATLLLVVAAVFSNVTFPALARACEDGDVSGQRVLTATLQLLVALLAPLAVGGAVMAESIIRLLFSPAFVPAGLPLTVLLAAYLAMACSDLLRRTLMARHHQHQDLAPVALSMLISLGAIAALSPWLGAFGAAAATAFGECVMLALAYRALRRTGFQMAIGRAIGPSITAALTMGAAMLLSRHWSDWVSLGVGAAVYLGWVWFARRPLLSAMRQLQS